MSKKIMLKLNCKKSRCCGSTATDITIFGLVDFLGYKMKRLSKFYSEKFIFQFHIDLNKF